MRQLNTIRAIAAGLMLTFTAASANAAVIYSTDYTTSAAPGAIASGGNNTGGGLCVPGATNCAAANLGAGSPNGNGLISISGATTGVVGNYTISVTISPDGNSLTTYGSIWDVTVVSGGVGTALGHGITNIVPIGTQGGGTVSGIVSGNGTFTIGITDLTEQYYSATDNLPSALGASSSLNGGTLNFPYAIFSLSYSVTPAPEPASLGLLAGGIVALGTLRRRRR